MGSPESLDSRAKDSRSIAISLAGQGKRDVSLSYVVTAPIWKTSYRLLLPKSGDKAMLQGWAVLENMTGSDWDKVDLWWGDERFLPAGHPDRNETQAREALLDHVPVDPARVHAMPASDGPLGEDLVIGAKCLLDSDLHVSIALPKRGAGAQGGRDHDCENEDSQHLNDSLAEYPRISPTAKIWYT